MRAIKVFLGGTCGKPLADTPDDITKWRDHIIPMLKIDYFNPVVSNWNRESQLREDSEKNTADIHLYVITPLQIGWYSFVEMALSAFSGKKTLIVFYKSVLFPEHHRLAAKKIKQDLQTYSNSQVIFTDSLDEIAVRLNNM
jgi:hypothetical protein